MLEEFKITARVLAWVTKHKFKSPLEVYYDSWWLIYIKHLLYAIC